MKQFVLPSMLFVAALTGCDEQTESKTSTSADSVAKVKDGVLELDKSTTVGRAFDGFRYFSTKTWTPTISENGRKLVEAIGTVDLSKVTSEDIAAATANAFGPSANTSQSNATLRNAQRQLKGAQFVFQFVLNVDNTFELKEGKMILLRADGKSIPTPIDGEYTLKEIYEGRLPDALLSSILLAGAQ
jgi:hypothetical protein